MENINGSNATQNDDICYGEFYAKFSKNFNKYNVTLNTKQILFSNKDENLNLICKNIIGVHHEISRNENDHFTLLLIYYYPIIEKPKTELLQFRQTITLKVQASGKTRSENEELAETWRKAILLSSFKMKISLDTLSNFSLPKRRFYVILNPFSGRRKALKIFKKVQQIFYEAEIGYKLVQTTHAGHAEKLASSEDFSNFDTIVTISGDGLIYEVVNGLMNRATDGPGPTIALAPLPAGSGNGFVTSLVYTFPGPSVMSKSLFALIKKNLKVKNRTVPLIKAEFNQKVRYSCLYIASGIIADTDINSETLRFLGGPIRTTLYGAAYVLRKKNYNYKIKTENAENSRSGDFLGIGIAVMPFVDEKMMLFPEVLGDTPGMYLQEIKHSISRLSLLDRWEKAEDGGKHTEIEPKELMSNSKISSIEVRSPNDTPILFTLDGEPCYTNCLKATELTDRLSIYY